MGEFVKQDTTAIHPDVRTKKLPPSSYLLHPGSQLAAAQASSFDISSKAMHNLTIISLDAQRPLSRCLPSQVNRRTGSSMSYNCDLMLSAILYANNGGTAFPTCVNCLAVGPTKLYQSGNPCNRADSLTDNVLGEKGCKCERPPPFTPPAIILSVHIYP